MRPQRFAFGKLGEAHFRKAKAQGTAAILPLRGQPFASLIFCPSKKAAERFFC